MSALSAAACHQFTTAPPGLRPKANGPLYALSAVETIFPAFGFGDTAVRVTTIALVIGLIPAIILSWVYEITPEGLKLERNVDRSRSITPQTGRKLDRMIMMGLALSVSYFAFDKFVMDPRRDAENLELATEQAVEQAIAKMEAALPERSIAVLPFVDLSEEGDNEYFSDGIAEELLNLLAKIPELRVISRSSAFSFKGKDFDIPSIASQLKVRHILEGSVRKSGNQVRITAQLIDANTDSHLWSETYDRTMDNIFAIQDEISARVVEQLRITLVGEAPRAEVSPPEAYTAYLQARHLSRQQAQDANEGAGRLRRMAASICPQRPGLIPVRRIASLT
jgi:TolB-like protein